MIEQETPPCALGLDDQTLSALRDEALPPGEAGRVREHATDCAACAARLAGFDAVASALWCQRELEPGDRVWLGVRERVADSSAPSLRRGVALPPGAWRAAASVAVVVGLLAYVLASAGMQRGGPTSAPTATAARPTVTAAPTATPLPTSPALTPEQAWGPNAATLTLDTQLDATHVFHASTISPDGKYLTGYEAPAPGTFDTSNGRATSSAGYYDLATRRFTAIGITQPWLAPPACCQTDGRYLLATQDTAPGTTCGLCHLTYYSYDLRAGSLWQIARGVDYGMVLRVSIGSGLAMLATGQGIMVADLAARSIKPLALPIQDPADIQMMAYAPPYLVYAVLPPNSSHPTIRAHDLATGRDMALPSLTLLSVGGELSAAISGDTLFVGRAASLNAQQGAMTLYEDDAFLSATAQPRQVASVMYCSCENTPQASAANGRLVLLSNTLLWDRAEGQLVSINPHQSVPEPMLNLAGHFLVAIQATDQSSVAHQSVTIYDTDRLRTAPSP